MVSNSVIAGFGFKRINPVNNDENKQFPSPRITNTCIVLGTHSSGFFSSCINALAKTMGVSRLASGGAGIIAASSAGIIVSSDLSTIVVSRLASSSLL